MRQARSIGPSRFLAVDFLLPLLCFAPTKSAFAAGALAFGQNSQKGGWSSGSAYNYATAEDAANGAMSQCHLRKEAGSYCKVIATVSGECFAIAVQDNGNGYGWDKARSLPEAQRLAVGRCQSYGKSCAVREGFCDTASSSASPPAATPAPAPAAPGPNTTGGGSAACQKFPNLC